MMSGFAQRQSLGIDDDVVGLPAAALANLL